MKVDIGDNTAGLIEGLAHQLQMTTEQVFPYYVKAAYIYGIFDMLAVTLCLLMFISITKWSIGKIGEPFERKQNLPPVIGGIVGALFTLILIFGFCAAIPRNMERIYAPEKAAISEMINDASKLRGK